MPRRERVVAWSFPVSDAKSDDRAQPLRLRLLAGSLEQGFEITAADGWSVLASPLDGGWHVRADAGEGWYLRRVQAEGAEGFRLDRAKESADGSFALSTHAAEAPGPGGPVSLLMPDGSLFWMARRPGDSCCYEVSRWEGPGAYWRASLGADGWEIAPTPAGREQGRRLELLVLSAAEILSAAGGVLDGPRDRAQGP